MKSPDLLSLTEEFVAAPSTVEELYEQLDLILGACARLQDLMEERFPITEREVTKLRKSFWFVLGETEKLRRGELGTTEGNSSASANSTDTEDSSANISYRYGSSEPVRRRLSRLSSSSRSISLESARKDDPKVVACDKALQQLEDYVKTRPGAKTFDEAGNPGGWRFFSIPIQRRLQTLVVSVFLFFTFIPFACFLTVILLLNIWTAPFMMAYLIYIYTAGKPKHPLKKHGWFAKLAVWRYYRDYFPIRLVIPRYVRRQFDPTKNYFFVYHPHGIHGFGAIVNFALDANGVSSLLPGITIHSQTLKVNFFVPFWRELLHFGGTGDASKECICRTLRAGPGESVLLVVGGAQESLLAKPNTNELALLKRKGFVKIALEEGVPLVPVYAFGENDVYRVPRVAQTEWYKKFSDSFRKITTFAFPLFVGRGWFNYGFGVVPHRRPIVVVVGEPLEIPKIANPTSEDLQYWHDKYVEALLRLFNEHRGVYDLESTGLRVI